MSAWILVLFLSHRYDNAAAVEIPMASREVCTEQASFALTQRKVDAAFCLRTGY